MRPIDTIIVHCSASGDVSAGTIRHWHLNRGWRDIGYHYVIRKSGAIEIGRPIEQVGAHAHRHNQTSIGICLTGGKDGAVDYTPEQMHSLEVLCHGLNMRYGLGLRVIGHNDVTASKTCPNFDVWEWWNNA